MGKKPTPQHSLDRIDVNGNYCKQNCRWATTLQQVRNKQRTILITYKDKTLTLQEWADITGIKKSILSNRYYKGWKTERMLETKPVREWTMKK